MKFQTKETELTDSSKVYDVDLFPNGRDIIGRDKVIFTCESISAQFEFITGLKKLVDLYTVETLEEVGTEYALPQNISAECAPKKSCQKCGASLHWTKAHRTHSIVTDVETVTDFYFCHQCRKAVSIETAYP